MSSNSKDPDIRQWEEAYELAGIIRKMQPWKKYYESDYFGFLNPFTNEAAFVSLMGSGGEHLAVTVYPDASSLAQIEQIVAGEQVDDFALLFVPQVQLSFEDRKMVMNEDRAVMKQVGRKYRGKHAWPVFRSYAAGYVPWFVTRDELELLLTALRLVAYELPKHSDQLEKIDLGRRFAESGEVIMLDGGAADAFRFIDRPPERLIDPELDVSQIEAIIDWQPVKNVIELDLTFLPSPVGDHERPYFPGLLIAVTQDEGFIIGYSMLSPIPDYASAMAKLPSAFLDTLSQHRVMPSKLVVRNRQVYHALKAIADNFGLFELIMQPRLPAAEAAISNMMRMPFMG